MDFEALRGIMIPFWGTSLGAACVFFMKGEMNERIQKALTGFAAGVMTAASVWSLIVPAIEQSDGMGKLSFIPAAAGFWIGILFLLFLDKIILSVNSKNTAKENGIKNIYLMIFAVVLHNIPEGMAVGAVFAGYLGGNEAITLAGAFALSLGIAIQNFPEGAIVSMPIRAIGEKKGKAFFKGVMSGAVEPIGAVLTMIAAAAIVPLMPYLLSFAAGAMIYVVVEELVPEMNGADRSYIGSVMFSLGFTVMMSMDVALG